MNDIVGRHKEKEILERLHRSTDAQFLAVYGRRRIGKTYLVRQFFRDRGLFFEVTGSKGASRAEQIEYFYREFTALFGAKWGSDVPTDWNEALHRLNQAVSEISPNQKMILFFDELPWLATPRSGFLRALDYFWNRHFSQRKNLILIICGSAASWMLRKIIRDRGGLHGRLSAQIRLQPFSVSEVEEFLLAKGIRLKRKQIIELYMAIGGVAKYLNYVTKGKSVPQIVNELCFTSQAPLLTEFHQLYESLFDKPDRHMRIVRLLAKKRYGISQNQLLAEAGLSSGGRSAALLEELEESGFILRTVEFGRKHRERKIRLVDEYSLFYLTWIEEMREQILNSSDQEYWNRQARSQRWASWAGYAFETICLKHVSRIQNALGLSGITLFASHWSEQGGPEIDLVMDRADQCINLCEIKFFNEPYQITSTYEEKLEEKITAFQRKTKTRKNLFLTMITPYGLMGDHPIVDNEITLDALF